MLVKEKPVLHHPECNANLAYTIGTVYTLAGVAPTKSEYVLVDCQICSAEAAENDVLKMVVMERFLSQIGFDGVDGNFCRGFWGITVCAGADAGECYALNTVFASQGQAVLVAVCKSLWFTVQPILPVRADRMDNVFRSEFKTWGYTCLPYRAASNAAACFQQVRPGGTVYCPINTASTQQRGVGGIDNGINLQGGDVGLNRMKFWHGHSFRRYRQPSCR